LLCVKLNFSLLIIDRWYVCTEAGYQKIQMLTYDYIRDDLFRLARKILDEKFSSEEKIDRLTEHQPLKGRKIHSAVYV
jgi:hypothetical protein